MVCPVADSEAFHNESIEEEGEVRADDLVALNLVELINEEKRAPRIDVQLVTEDALSDFSSLRHLIVLEDGDIIGLWLGSFPVNQVHIEDALVEYNLHNDERELGGGHETEEKIVLFEILPVGRMSRHKAVDTLLQLEKDEPVPNHKEEVPEVDGGKEVKEVHDCVQDTGSSFLLVS